MTPNELAEELGRSPKQIRSWLRKLFPRDEIEKWERWEITPRMALAVRNYAKYAGRRS